MTNVKKKVWSFLMTGMLMTIGVAAFCQQSIQFVDLSFAEAQQTAQREGKIIFVDVQSSGTKSEFNKKVEQQVFTLDSVVQFFNNNCVNIAIDMGSEAGKAFAPNLNMLMYPAYVFYDAHGAQLEFTNAGSILKDPGVLMQKARASSAVAEVKNKNTRKIEFQKESWADVLALAKREGKLIFLDAQTEWCRPCRMMERNVFNLDKVADFYNANFINVSMDMEKTDGPSLRKQYSINAYPAYLFIDPNTGAVIHRDGGYTEADAFLQIGEKALKQAGKTPIAQTGIQFIEGSWEALLAQAKKEDKLIFLDCYTTWCGPCKTMAKEVFTTQPVGDFFNKTFINAKRDMEKGEGLTLSKQYDIKAYPTFLFINGDGVAVHRIVGSSPAEQFLGYAKDVLKPENRLGEQMARYEAGDRDPLFIQSYLETLSLAYEKDEAAKVASVYLASIPRQELVKPENWTLIKAYVKDPTDAALQYVLKHQDALKETHSGVDVTTDLENLVSQTIFSVFYSKEAYDPSTQKAIKKMLRKADLPHIAELRLQAELLGAGKAADWANYQTILDNMIQENKSIYGRELAVAVANFAPLLLNGSSEYASKVVEWTNMLLEKAGNKLDQSKLYSLQYDAYKKAGETEKAELAQNKSETLVNEWKAENKNKGMMMAVPMKLQ